MGYRRVTVELLYQIHVRLRAGDSHRMIAAALGLDKKTVNQYAQRMLAINIPVAVGDKLPVLVGENFPVSCP